MIKMSIRCLFRCYLWVILVIFLVILASCWAYILLMSTSQRNHKKCHKVIRRKIIINITSIQNMANWLKYKQTYKLKVKCTDRRFSKVTMLHIMGWEVFYQCHDRGKYVLYCQLTYIHCLNPLLRSLRVVRP